MSRVPTTLTIAGSDSGGGAGIQADLKTFFALGVHGASAITAITAQNTVEVTDSLALPTQMVRAQIDTVMADLAVESVKTGMLSNAEIVAEVASAIQTHRITKAVIDPVMMSSSGAQLLSPDAVSMVMERLLPVAMVVTPNLDETEVLVGKQVRSVGEMKDAAKLIHDRGPKWVLVKGGHLEGASLDVLYGGEDFHEFTADRIGTGSAHGSGCTLSAAIAALLALGHEVVEAVDEAKRFVTGGLQHAHDVARDVERGVRPVNQRWMLESASGDGADA